MSKVIYNNRTFSSLILIFIVNLNRDLNQFKS